MSEHAQLEAGKTYRFKGTTHETVYVVVDASGEYLMRCLVLDFTPFLGPGFGFHCEVGTIIEVSRSSRMALEATPLVLERFSSSEEQGKVSS